MPATPEIPLIDKPMRWWAWLGWSIALWILPACMMAVWGHCYTEFFGEPPCETWATATINSLFTLNFAVVVLYLFLSRKRLTHFVLSLLVGFVQIVVTTLIWFWGGMSVSGFYF